MAIDYLSQFGSTGPRASRSTTARSTPTRRTSRVGPTGSLTGSATLSPRTATSPTYTPTRAAAIPQDIMASRSGVSATDPGVFGAASTGYPGGASNGVLDESYTGWAKGVTPDMVDMLFQEPQALLRQVMSGMGMSANQNPGMYYAALPNADLVNALMMLQSGGQGFDAGNKNALLNQMGDFFAQGITRGGKGVDFGGGLGNALNAGVGTPLGDFLNLDDPRGQVQAMKSLIMPLAQGGLHPLFAQAFQSEIDRLADEYYSRAAFGDPGGQFQDLLARRLK